MAGGDTESARDGPRQEGPGTMSASLEAAAAPEGNAKKSAMVAAVMGLSCAPRTVQSSERCGPSSIRAVSSQDVPPLARTRSRRILTDPRGIEFFRP